MKQLVLVLFLVWASAWGKAAFAARLLWPVVTDASNQVTLVGETWGALDRQGTEVFPEAKGTLSNEDALRTLSRYYQLMKSGEVERAGRLYTSEDGSSERFAAEYRKKPHMYDVYKALERVVVYAVLKWGDYRYVYLRVTGSGATREWREVLLCRPECRMSNALNIIDQTRELYILAVGHFLRSAFSASPAKLAERAKKSGLVRPGNAALVVPEWLGDPVRSYRFPVALYPRFVAVGPVRAMFDDPEAQHVGKDRSTAVLPQDLKDAVGAYRKFLRDYEGLGIDMTRLDEVDESVLQRIRSIFGKYWNGYRKGNLFRVYEPIDSRKVAKGATLYSVSRENYTAFAYASRASQWDGMEFVGYVDAGVDRYWYFFPLRSGKRMGPLQVLPTRKTAGGYALSLRPYRTVAGRVLTGKAVVSMFNDRLAERQQ